MKISAGEKKLLILCGFILALPLGVGAFFGRINAPPVVQIPAYPKAPKPNGYDFYVKAAKMIVAWKPPVGVANDTQIVTNPKIAAQRYGLKRKTAWLAANCAGYATFKRALQTPALAPPERSFMTGVNFSDSGRLRELARNTLARSDTFWMRGNFGAALQSDLDIVQMGHDTRRGGALIKTLVGTAISAMGRSGSYVLVDELDAAQAKKGARRLEKMLQTRWNLAQTLTEEKYATQNSWLEILATGEWRSPNMATSGDESPSLAERWQIATISKQRIMDDLGANYDRQIANARLPYAHKSAPPRPLNDPFVEIYQGSGDKMRFNDARDLAGDQLLMLQLALRAYRVKKGVYPADLNALTPNYLGAIPADPFDSNENWRYELNGQNYQLWSIGPDGRDDGAAPIPWPKPPRRRLGSRPRLPTAKPDSRGDIVAGKNS